MRMDYWTEPKAWIVPVMKLPHFLAELRQASDNYMRWAKKIAIKDAGDCFIVIAMTTSYPYQDNKMEDVLK